MHTLKNYVHEYNNYVKCSPTCNVTSTHPNCVKCLMWLIKSHSVSCAKCVNCFTDGVLCWSQNPLYETVPYTQGNSSTRWSVTCHFVQTIVRTSNVPWVELITQNMNDSMPVCVWLAVLSWVIQYRYTLYNRPSKYPHSGFVLFYIINCSPINLLTPVRSGSNFGSIVLKPIIQNSLWNCSQVKGKITSLKITQY